MLPVNLIILAKDRIEDLFAAALMLPPDAEVAGNRFPQSDLSLRICSHGKPDGGGGVGKGDILTLRPNSSRNVRNTGGKDTDPPTRYRAARFFWSSRLRARSRSMRCRSLLRKEGTVWRQSSRRLVDTKTER